MNFRIPLFWAVLGPVIFLLVAGVLVMRRFHHAHLSETTPAGSITAPVAVEPMPTSQVLGVHHPQQLDIQWTAYYVVPAKFAPQGQGRQVQYTNLAGQTTQITITNECYNQVEIEAAAVGVDKDGVEHFAYRVSEGVWKELPQGCAGMGNKLNLIVPMIHVAADQRKFPYGSMVYVDKFAGIKLGDNEVTDGYFWVGDVGGGVVGNHFDLFVGNEVAYKDVLSRDTKPTYPTMIYALPIPPKKFDPRSNEGLTALMRHLGLIKAETTSVEKYEVLDALLLFQQANPHIPPAEYGNPRAATTLWFLIQAALKTAH